VGETRKISCNLCEALCGLEVDVEGGRVTAVRGNPADVLSRGHLCPKGPALAELYDDPDRLRAPVRRTASGWQTISWDEALDEAARRLRAIRREHGKDAIGYYVGNPTVHNHRAAIGMQLLQSALGTRNRFDANSQDSNPRLFACMQMYGDGLSMPVPDVDRTDLFVIFGANPAASNGSMMSLGDVRGRLRGIRERGGRVVVIDPRRTETARSYADQHLFIRPGGDAALALALLHVLFAERLVDGARVTAIADGAAALRDAAARFSPERVGPAIGIDPAAIRALARALGTTERAVVYGRVGTCQNEFGPTANWLIEALNVVTGHLDRPGGAMFPQPAADVGPLARRFVGNHYDRWRSRVRGLPEFLGSLPAAVMAEEMDTPGEGQIRAFVCFAGNPVLSTPNGARLERALAGLDFVLSVDIYLNETSRLAHLVLPPAHLFETGNYDLLLLGLAVRNVAKYSPPILPRSPGARDDWEILSDLAMRVAGPGWSLLERAWRRAARDLPERAIDLLLRTGRYNLSLAKLRAAPDGIDLGPLEPALREKVRTPDGRVRLAPPALMADLPRLERWLDERPAGGLVLIGRRHLRSNNSWMHNARSLAKGPDRARLLVHPADATRLGIADGQAVQVQSRAGAVAATAALSDEVMEGVVSLPHGFGHAAAADTLRVAGALPGASANLLTDEQQVEPLCGTSILNGVPVTVAPLSS
jgi:anaerobic selenocysteine-containing dehydrogenase